MFSVRSRISINRIRLEFKGRLCVSSDATLMRINRIRLEFKAFETASSVDHRQSINRIRLEFKEKYDGIEAPGQPVLIESDWNLKQLFFCIFQFFDGSINRIRLEFKVSSACFFSDSNARY